MERARLANRVGENEPIGMSVQPSSRQVSEGFAGDAGEFEAVAGAGRGQDRRARMIAVGADDEVVVRGVGVDAGLGLAQRAGGGGDVGLERAVNLLDLRRSGVAPNDVGA